MVTEEKMMKL